MNRYPLWKYIIISIVLLVGGLYALPNVFGESPAVQISSVKNSAKVDTQLLELIEKKLLAANIKPQGYLQDERSIRLRFADTQTQLAAKDVLAIEFEKQGYVVALNLLSETPHWLTSINALPMYLGLDLRGGVHFLLQIDMAAALTKRLDSLAIDARVLLRDRRIPFASIDRVDRGVRIAFRDSAARDEALGYLSRQITDLQFTSKDFNNQPVIEGSLILNAEIEAKKQALAQNITTLSNRVNELGVAEPIVQQQGDDRIVVQLPGVQDTARAKELLGRTATLEIRMVDDSARANVNGPLPYDLERFPDRYGRIEVVKRQVILTGENLINAQPGFDQQNNQPAVFLTFDGKGARIFADVTRENINKRMAILLFEKGQGEVVTAPVIRSEILGGRVQISGSMTTIEASDIALLLRAGSLAAPMEIIEERTIGPSLGKENIERGYRAVIWGFVVIIAFMVVYYMMFGIFSSLALGVNLILLIAVLSMLQATLTVPGIAAIALTLGMAIDANVLINERVREELREGKSPQIAIAAGYERAWGTILDSNVTTLIAGVALLVFGSGPVRGFAVVHSLGILTSMFSAVLFSRALVNLWYGSRRKLNKVMIG